MSGEYNGWTNYATWRINLELLSDYIDSLVSDGTQFADESALREHLRTYVDETLEMDGSGLVLDYAQAFVSDVNYYEISQMAWDEHASLREGYGPHRCLNCDEEFDFEDELAEHEEACEYDLDHLAQDGRLDTDALSDGIVRPVED